MSERSRWTVTVAASMLLAAAAGGMIFLQNRQVDTLHAKGSELRAKIEKDRALIKKTPDLVKEVIIQRETDAQIKEMLSDEKDVNNLVRTLQSFGDQSGITKVSLKQQKGVKSSRKKDDFERVGYTLEFDSDAFELLAFLDLVESHARFMSVTRFKLSAARRQAFAGDALPRHHVQLDLETYVYQPKDAKEVRIDNYEHKRDLLVSEIAKRGADLRIPGYEFRGPRGRRDPWIDPRMPASKDGVPVLTIEEQITLVEELVLKADEAEAIWKKSTDADNLIGEMKTRAELEESLALLDERVRRVEEEGQLVFVPARNRFESQVVDRLADIRLRLDSTQGGLGPSVAELEESAKTMKRFIGSQDYELALQAFQTLEPRLAAISERDEIRRPYVTALAELKRLAATVLEFESIQLQITGIAILENARPVALINGQAISEGELIGDELYVRNIQRNQIEFAYRGLVLARPIDSK
ncbi:MAG: hypothetical protein AB1726_18465 [Planctomycetota bacterium]